MLEKVSVTEGIKVKTFHDQRMLKMANTLKYFHLHTTITQNKKLGYLGNYNLIKAYRQRKTSLSKPWQTVHRTASEEMSILVNLHYWLKYFY